jgi:sugar phosphate isomerase/epimerase
MALMNRRSFLLASGAMGLAPALRAKAKLSGIKIGVTDWNLRLTGKVEAVALAAGLGFEGVEISLGSKQRDGKLPLADAGLQAEYLDALKKHKIGAAGTCLDILHVNYLKNDKLGQKWLADGIPITKKLNARVMLMPSFGKGSMKTPAELDYVGDVLRELGPEAEKAGVILGLENTNSAEENVRIMDRAKSKAVKVYYDVGNSTNGGYDILKEIRWLGKDRICQMHFKDKGYMGEGKIDFPAVIQAVAEIDFRGFANLETSAPSGSVENDMKRNLGFVRDLIEKAKKS